MGFLLNLLSGQGKETPRRIVMTEAVTVRPLDRLDLVPAKPGDVFDVEASVADTLVQQGSAKFQDKNVQQRRYVPPPRPEKTKPDPLPEYLKDLPGDFAAAFAIEAKRRALAQDIENAREQVPHNAFGEDGMAYLALMRGRVDDATEALKAHDDSNGYKLASLHMKCGQHALAQIEAANQLVDELNDTAFRLFNTRIASLELSERHARTLYDGSAVCLKYQTQRITPFDVVFLGGERPRVAIDADLRSIAYQARRADELIAKVKPLLAEAKATLKKTEAAAKQAA